VTVDELLEALIATLEHIERLVPTDRPAWDADERTPLAVERLWIEAGNTAEEYRRSIHLVGEREIQAADLTALARCNPGFDTYGFWAEPCGAVPAFCPSATPEVW
jgi:hypothetical protein